VDVQWKIVVKHGPNAMLMSRANPNPTYLLPLASILHTRLMLYNAYYLTPSTIYFNNISNSRSVIYQYFMEITSGISGSFCLFLSPSKILYPSFYIYPKIFPFYYWCL